MDILLIEDERADAIWFEREARDVAPNARVHHVTTAADARKWLLANRAPRLIVCDVRLPLEDGISLAAEFRTSLPGSTIIENWSGATIEGRAILEKTREAVRGAVRRATSFYSDLERVDTDLRTLTGRVGSLEEDVEKLAHETAQATAYSKTASADARRAAESSAKAVLVLEAMAEREGPVSYAIRKAAESITAWVLVSWGIGLTIACVAGIAVVAFAAGVVDDFQSSVSAQGASFGASSDRDEVNEDTDNDGAGEVWDTAPPDPHVPAPQPN